MFDTIDLEMLYDAVGEALDALNAEAETNSEIYGHDSEEVEALQAKIASYEGLRKKMFPAIHREA